MMAAPTPDELEALERELLEDPEILREMTRYRPLVQNLGHKSLVALRMVAHAEINKRVRDLEPPTRIGQRT